MTLLSRRLLAGLLAALSILACLALLGGPARAESTYPTWPTTLPGVNDFGCRPTAAHPTPVIVVHGTFGDHENLLRRLELTLVDRGYCVFAPDYGNRATAPVEQSAAELDGYVERVRTATGAAKVSLVGHSQGGMMPRYYIKYLGGDAVVDDLVGLAPSNHGTYNTALLAPSGLFCASCLQQASDSAFLADLNAGDETPGPVSYTSMISRYDAVVVPYRSAFLAGPAAQTTNLLLQDACPFDVSGHLSIPSDGLAIRTTLDALAHPGPASPTRVDSCLP